MKTIKSLINSYDRRSILTRFILLTLGGIILAVNINFFIAPSQIAPGGVSGAAIIIHEFISWPIGTMMLILNIPLLFVGFKYLGRFDFLIRTLYVILIYNVGVDILAYWTPSQGITDNMMLNALYGGVLGGLGTGLVYRARGTSGGTGIVGRVLQFKTGFPVSQLYLLTDGGVVLIAGIVFGWDHALYALVTLYIWGVTADQVLEGPSVVRTVLIVTDQPKAVADTVFHRLRIGITSWPAQGMFTEKKHTVLYFVVSRPEVEALKTVVLDVDQHAFIVIGIGHHAIGGVYKQVVQTTDHNQ
jgi:uncharacterized membrane-anchored protein YitT (DUF2179 family)